MRWFNACNDGCLRFRLVAVGSRRPNDRCNKFSCLCYYIAVSCRFEFRVDSFAFIRSATGESHFFDDRSDRFHGVHGATFALLLLG